MLLHVLILFYIVRMSKITEVSDQQRKGRGAFTNQVGRFEPYTYEAVDDGWEIDEDQPPLRTEVALEAPRSVITKNTSPDISFEQSINPYRGCEHGCIYCFARPSHAWLGLSPGLDFETKLVARPGAPMVLARELGRRTYIPKMIAIGTNTDPYQPIEYKFRVMRGLLKVLLAHRHPVGIVTKGAALIEADLDLLTELAALGLLRVGVSVTTLDRHVARVMEPRVPAPRRRLQTIERLAEAGVSVRAMISPIIPGLTDHEIETLVRGAADAGAQAASMIPLRLPLEVSGLFENWVQAHWPNRAGKIMARVREMHGGKTYDSRWHHRMKGQGTYVKLLHQRFARACGEVGFPKHLPPLRTDLFRVPPKEGDQLVLF